MKRKMIFDVGMNNGDDTAYYLHKGYDVVSVEANPQLAKKVSLRFKDEIKDGKLKILNVGVAETEGIIPFWICENHSEWSSFNRSIASRDGCKHHEILVPARQFSSIVAEFGVPYYLKIDIEGNDHLCLNSLREGSLPEFVSVEASDMVSVDLLGDLGYKRFKCISQFHYLPLELPASPQQLHYEKIQAKLESKNPFLSLARPFGLKKKLQKELNQNRVEGDWTFPFGSSGPFGEGLPGRWQTREEMRSTFDAFKKMMLSGKRSPFWTDKDYSFWADIHAGK